jgi:hypothetical protein
MIKVVDLRRIGLEFDSCVSVVPLKTEIMVTCQDNSNNHIADFNLSYEEFEIMSTFGFILKIVNELKEEGYEHRDCELYEIEVI